MRADAYAAHDPHLTRRFAGLMQLLTGGVLLFVVLLSHRPEQAVVATSLALFAAGTGVALVRGWTVSYGALLGLTYLNLGGLISLSILAGSESHRLEEAYLGVMLAAAALHPPRRVVPVFVVVVAAIAIGKADGGISGGEVLDMALHLTIWFFVAGMSSVTVKQLREQRLAAQEEGAAAQSQALSDVLTGLGNRRRLLADLDEAVAERREVMLAVFDLDGFKAYNDTYGHPAGDSLLRRLAERLAQVVGDRGVAYRMGGDEFCVLAAEDIVAEAALALCERGEGFTITASSGAIRLPADADSTPAALRLADHRMYARKSVGRASAARQTADVLLRVLAERQPELGDRLEGVGALAEELAREIGLPQDDLPALRLAATLHDVGMTAIPDAILAKPGPLDDEEWEFMRRHPVIGERILAAAPALTRAASIVRASHERFDGAGYPDGLAGEAIPLAARIVSVCDAYEAMCCARPYRQAMSHEQAVAELRHCSGTQFDPRVVEALCRVFAGRGAAASLTA